MEKRENKRIKNVDKMKLVLSFCCVLMSIVAGCFSCSGQTVFHEASPEQISSCVKAAIFAESSYALEKGDYEKASGMLWWLPSQMGTGMQSQAPDHVGSAYVQTYVQGSAKETYVNFNGTDPTTHDILIDGIMSICSLDNDKKKRGEVPIVTIEQLVRSMCDGLEKRGGTYHEQLARHIGASHIDTEGKVIFVGHSLGDSEAQLAFLEYSRRNPAGNACLITFNSLGVPSYMMERYADVAYDRSRVLHIVSEDDFVNNATGILGEGGLNGTFVMTNIAGIRYNVPCYRDDLSPIEAHKLTMVWLSMMNDAASHGKNPFAGGTGSDAFDMQAYEKIYRTKHYVIMGASKEHLQMLQQGVDIQVAVELFSAKMSEATQYMLQAKDKHLREMMVANLRDYGLETSAAYQAELQQDSEAIHQCMIEACSRK